MRVALLSDIHGNELALDAVLRDIEARGVDEIVCLGDVATLGPRPAEVVERLRTVAIRCIMGNHDQFLLEPDLVRSYSDAPPVLAAIDWCRARLSTEDLELIRSFQQRLVLPLAPAQELLLFHGTPSSCMEDIVATTPADTLDELLAGHSAPIMAGGHTHIQMLRQHRGCLLINPGSVGLPFKEYLSGAAGPPEVMSHAEYAIIEVAQDRAAVQLLRVTLDRGELRQAAEASDNPISGMLALGYADRPV